MTVDAAVTKNADAGRYEIHVDGELAGFTQFELHRDKVAFRHSEIDPRFKGQGLGSRLVGAALDDVRAEGLSVLPYCPFVRGFIAGHREYLDLVPENRRRIFRLE